MNTFISYFFLYLFKKHSNMRSAESSIACFRKNASYSGSSVFNVKNHFMHWTDSANVQSNCDISFLIWNIFSEVRRDVNFWLSFEYFFPTIWWKTCASDVHSLQFPSEHSSISSNYIRNANRYYHSLYLLQS